MSADQIIFMVVIIALLCKYILFEDDTDLVDQIRQSTKPAAAAALAMDEPVKEQQQPQQKQQEALLEKNSSTQQIPKIQINGTTTNATSATRHKKPIFTIEEEYTADASVQTDDIDWERFSEGDMVILNEEEVPREPRPVEECIEILNSSDRGQSLTDEEVISVVKAGGGHCPLYNIESVLNNPERGVKIRREMITQEAGLKPGTLNNLPFTHYDYSKVMNACCENVLGYVQIPFGYAGPLLLDGKKYWVPMATTEGALWPPQTVAARPCPSVECPVSFRTLE